MATGTKIRSLTRLLDASAAPLWAIGPAGGLVYLSAGVADWLGVDIESLIDRRSVAGAPISDHPLDRLAASLSPPHGLALRGTASLRIQPPAIGDHRPDPIEVRFLRVGQGDAALTIAVGGSFLDRVADPELQDTIAYRQRLDVWRKRHAAIATIATAGISAAARRMRKRLQVAGSVRTDIGFFGPPGCGSESIARRIHGLSAAGESLLTVDGPLMDSELLDATLMPLINQLANSSDSSGTALVRSLDEMPLEAQQRLATILGTFAGRLRLLALCGSRPAELSDASDDEQSSLDPLTLEDKPRCGIYSPLAEILSTLRVVIEPLASRVEDIPLLATAMLDNRFAAREGTAERLSRAALDALVIYPWPGNVDELDAAIRHAIRTATGSSISVEHLPLAVRSFRPGGTARTKSTVSSLDEAVQRYEMRLINEALEASDGNRAEAARRLGISRARLLRKVDDQAKSSPPRKRGHGND